MNWVKNENNPVLSGTPGNWNQYARQPVVLFEDSIFKLWYLGSYGTNYQVGYAESEDGISWTLEDDPVIPSGQPGDWDRNKGPQTVLRINDTLKMWYHASPDPNFSIDFAIGYAWSLNGLEWNLNPEPVLEKGVTGSWDESLVYSPHVYYDGTQYHMWYSGSMNNASYDQVGYAVSNDGINWTKDDINNPVIELGDPGTWYDTWVIAGPVFKCNNGIFQMWFGGDDGSYTYRIGFATSPDKIHWTIHNDLEPVLDVGNPGEWDEKSVHSPTVILHDGIYKIWYGGRNISNIWKTGYAESNSPILRVPSQYPTIQDAIDAACDGNTVLVDQGTYYENINFNGKAITVMSNYLYTLDSADIYNTIIDGSQSSNPDSASVVYFSSGEDTTSVLCGFTIQHGTGTYPDAFGDLSGGGVTIEYAGAKIIHNRIINNSLITNNSRAFGAGIVTTNLDGIPTIIRDNLFADNAIQTSSSYYAAGAAMLLYGPHIVKNNIIKNNDVTGKWARGAGIYADNPIESPDGIGIIAGNQIIHNTADITGIVGFGCGVYVINLIPGYTISNNIISYNIFTGINPYGAAIGIINWTDVADYYIQGNIMEFNEAQNGGAICITSWATGFNIEHNLFNSNNASNRAGAIYLYNSTSEDLMKNNPGRVPRAETIPLKSGTALNGPAQIINNTFYSNFGSNSGGAIYNGFNLLDVALTNNIFYLNNATTGPDVYTNLPGSSCDVNYNCIETSLIYGNWSGSNNFYEDPLFENTELNDFHLLPGSPCIDTGDPTYIDPDNSTADVGAYYFDSIPVVALDATEMTGTSFQANWQEVENTTGYLLDVAYDDSFTNMVDGYHNLDVGNVLSYTIENLVPLTAYYYRFRANYYFGRSGYSNTILASTLTSIDEQAADRKENLSIVPNPLSPNTRLSYYLKAESLVLVDIYTINGRHVLQLVNAVQNQGKHEVVLDSSSLSPGIYCCTLKTGDGVQTKKIIKLH
ncbi:MAG: T9SS type A sorting domain-containing protein [Bacteroidetes bacterium]|nr:T9SS type A sorting domain-containing protein [Bacteroidota bacterium]